MEGFKNAEFREKEFFSGTLGTAKVSKYFQEKEVR